MPTSAFINCIEFHQILRIFPNTRKTRYDTFEKIFTNKRSQDHDSNIIFTKFQEKISWRLRA